MTVASALNRCRYVLTSVVCAAGISDAYALLSPYGSSSPQLTRSVGHLPLTAHIRLVPQESAIEACALSSSSNKPATSARGTTNVGQSALSSIPFLHLCILGGTRGAAQGLLIDSMECRYCYDALGLTAPHNSIGRHSPVWLLEADSLQDWEQVQTKPIKKWNVSVCSCTEGLCQICWMREIHYKLCQPFSDPSQLDFKCPSCRTQYLDAEHIPGLSAAGRLRVPLNPNIFDALACADIKRLNQQLPFESHRLLSRASWSQLAAFACSSSSHIDDNWLISQIMPLTTTDANIASEASAISMVGKIEQLLMEQRIQGESYDDMIIGGVTSYECMLRQRQLSSQVNAWSQRFCLLQAVLVVCGQLVLVAVLSTLILSLVTSTVITHYFSHAQYDKLLRSWLRLERYHPISAPFLYRIYQDDQPMQILCGTSPMLHPIVMQALRQRKVVELLLERDKIHSLLASYSDHVWKPFPWIGVTAIALCITHCLLPLGSLLWCMIIVQWLYLWLGMAACLVYLRLPASVEEHVRLFKSQHCSYDSPSLLITKQSATDKQQVVIDGKYAHDCFVRWRLPFRPKWTKERLVLELEYRL
jgi:hypothetical protein